MKHLRIFFLSTLFFSTLAFVPTAHADPVRSIPGLSSISFYERTGGTAPTEYVFAVNGPELTTLLSNPLGAGNADFGGATSEYYDVYYSNADGSFNLDGEYLSISGVFNFGLPNGGGLNLAEISLNYIGDVLEFGNFVASYIALGDNAFEEFVGRAIDGDLQTHTVMGNTMNSDQRLRLTLGFLSSSGEPPDVVPLPAALPLFAGGLAGFAWLTRRRKKMID